MIVGYGLQVYNKFMHHYICLGGCEGVSEQPKKCGEKTCHDYGKELKHCDCADGKHEGEFAKKDKLKQFGKLTINKRSLRHHIGEILVELFLLLHKPIKRDPPVQVLIQIFFASRRHHNGELGI